GRWKKAWCWRVMPISNRGTRPSLPAATGSSRTGTNHARTRHSTRVGREKISAGTGSRCCSTKFILPGRIPKATNISRGKRFRDGHYPFHIAVDLAAVPGFQEREAG